MPFEYIDDIAIADVAFRAVGQTVEEMFIAAAEATMGAMVERLEAIEPREARQIALSSPALDMLLFNLLQEIIFFKDAEQLLLRIESLTITSDEAQYGAKASARGEQIDSGRHETIVDVKAVTLHRFTVEQTARGWECFVILDI
ncbi:MAG: archease [Syntrophobacteraceae bacterium]|nr:archease [Syntrophobacteraceae bacterium]